jgi:hypothetical protein
MSYGFRLFSRKSRPEVVGHKGNETRYYWEQIILDICRVGKKG